MGRLRESVAGLHLDLLCAVLYPGPSARRRRPVLKWNPFNSIARLQSDAGDGGAVKRPVTAFAIHLVCRPQDDARQWTAQLPRLSRLCGASAGQLACRGGLVQTVT